MTTTPKAQKDKPYAATARLMPRQTAASAARAARNATNRNLMLPASQRQSPTRIKPKNPGMRHPPKCDSKSDIKIRNADVEDEDNVTVPVTKEHDSYIADSESVVIAEDSNENKIEDVGELDEIDSKCNENIRENESNDQLPVNNEQYPRSEPRTPITNSRPQTPKSLQSSRPQTPLPPSRPTTPAHPQNVTPVSRPNTPQTSSAPNRPTTPVHTIIEHIAPLNPSNHRPRSPINDDEDLMAVYTLKQKQFQSLKKELDLKQQAVLEVFDCLREIRDRMCQEGLGSGEGQQQHELVLFNVADWTADEISQLCRDAVASAASEGATDFISTMMPFDECAMEEMDAKMTTVPAKFADLCLQAFTARQELIDWVKNLLENYPDDGSNESLDRIAGYNVQGLQLCKSLQELKNSADSVVNTVTQLSRKACRERCALVQVGESLVREIARLRQDLESQAAIVNELQQAQKDNEIAIALEDTRKELEKERIAGAATKDKLSATEAQFRQARLRINKMDRQLREAEASIASLTGTVKSLEDQSKQREVQLEARARKLKECLKTGEVASGHIARKRDALQAEVVELKDKIETMTAQHKSTVQDLSNQLKDLKITFEEQKRMMKQEIEHKNSLQNSLTESQSTIEQLKQNIIELENSRPNPDLPTEREIDLWAELQATKDTLRTTEDEVAASKREKVRFLETMTKITDADNKVGIQQKLAAELLSKEEIMGKMQIQIRELTKNMKLNEQKVFQYEKYVRDLQVNNQSAADCQETANGIGFQDLQQEIMNLRMSLLEAVHRNDDLTETLAQREQLLEQQDKTSRAQARVIKVREELINMLKNKETEQSRELSTLQQDLEHRMNIVGEVNKQIAAKAEEIQELFATLENKQQQIHRLEKIVLALEEQQRRAQAQRTRHEEKIAALEHELAAGGNRRERKFLFF